MEISATAQGVDTATAEASTADVRRALLDRFSSGTRSNGSLGFFHPDRLSFGDPVALSPIIAETIAGWGHDFPPQLVPRLVDRVSGFCRGK